MPSTLVRRSATGSEKERMIETCPAMWHTASSPRAKAGSTSSGRMTSAFANRTSVRQILPPAIGFVVHHGHRVPVGQQATAQVRADKPGTARHQNSHLSRTPAGRPFRRFHSAAAGTVRRADAFCHTGRTTSMHPVCVTLKQSGAIRGPTRGYRATPAAGLAGVLFGRLVNVIAVLSIGVPARRNKGRAHPARAYDAECRSMWVPFASLRDGARELLEV